MSVCTIIKGAAAKLTRENTRLKMRLTEERENRLELEAAVVELAELYAEQDDAIVELAGLLEEG